MSKKKIALFHPWIKSKGGAERVVLEILKSKKLDIDLYTWIYDSKNTFKEFKNYNINIISPKIAEKLSRTYLLKGLFFPISLFSQIPLEKYDKFLISSSGVAEFITFRNYKKNNTYAYIHTPLRASDDKIIEWNLKNRCNYFSGIAYLFAAKFYLFLEKIAWKKIDYTIFNSELSLKRAKKRKLMDNKKFSIIYPPINVDKFKKLKKKKGDYFLYVSRFNPDKRQDVLIKAWKNFIKENPKEKLVLVGTIENKKYFKKLLELIKQTKNIEIKTNISNKELIKIYSNCRAGIFVGFMEDFGIVPFEFLAAGKPLISINQGGFVNLVKKHYNNHVIWVKEKKDITKNIEKGLKEFMLKKTKGKKTIIKGLDDKTFREKINKILLD